MLVEIKYLPPTNTKGSRLRVKCNQISIIIPYNYGVEDDTRALLAADALWNSLHCARKVYNKESRTIDFYEATKYESRSSKVVGYLDNKTFVHIDVVY